MIRLLSIIAACAVAWATPTHAQIYHAHPESLSDLYAGEVYSPHARRCSS
jgi:hypothetical protein